MKNDQDTSAEQKTDLVRTAGRGVVYITFAKLWFMITGYATFALLPWIFQWARQGDPEAGKALLGTYKLVIMGVSFINNSVVFGTIQAVSKFTSEDESQAGAVRRAAIKVQGLGGLLIAGIYVAFAGLLADALGSPDMALLMRISAGIIVAYSCYAVVIGSFNGQRLFHRQAIFDIIYATVKSVLIVVLAAVGFEVLGAVAGFLIAAVVIAVAASTVCGWEKQGAFPAKRYLSFAAILVFYTLVLNLALSFDLFLLKGISSHLAVSAGSTPEQASELSKTIAGEYAAAQYLAFIPYQAILAIAFVAFPLISKVTFSKDTEKTQAYIRKTMRFSLIMIAGPAAVFAALPEQAIGLVFPASYRTASGALGILAIGIVAFGLMVVSNTILNGAGQPRRAMAVVIAALVSVTGAVTGLLLFPNPYLPPVTATALGTSIGMGIGLVLSGVVVYRQFGAFCPIGSVIRVVLASASVIVAGRFLPDMGKMVTLVQCVLILGVYFGILVAIREFGREDLDQLKQVMKRGSKSKRK